MKTNLPFLLFNSGLYNSSAILSDYLLFSEEFSENEKTELKILMVRSFFNLNLHNRTYRFIEKNDFLLNFQCIRTIFYKLSNYIDSKNMNFDLLKNKRNDLLRFADTDSHEQMIDLESIELHLQGTSKTSTEKKELLISSVEIDNRNLESFIVLKRECLVTESELDSIIHTIDEELRVFFKKILFFDEQPLNNPYFTENVAFSVYNRRLKNQIIFMGMEMLEKYPDEASSFLIFGLAHITRKMYSDAKTTFYEAIKKERTLGTLWLFLGVSYSNLREYDSAISAFEYSKQLMIGSYKPDFYLAFEYHKMSNINHANIFYLNSLRIKREALVIIRYSALLIHFEYYNEAIKILEEIEIEKKDQNVYFMLLTYAFLFTGDIEKADAFLEKTKKDWRYFATKGYLFHLQSYAHEATEYYTSAIVHLGRSWILEDLLKHSIDLKDSKTENHVYDYGTSLFESLNLKSLDFVPF